MSHPFRFDIEKTIQAVAFLLRREPGHRMNYMRMLKILYLAERECLRDAGKPLTGSRVVAMKRGPVLEDVFDLIRGQHINAPRWSQFMQMCKFHVEMTTDPGIGQLSRFLTEKLNEIAERHDQHDEWDMVEITHRLPEWQMNDPGESSKEIPLAHILAAIGRADDEREVVSDDRRNAFMAKFFVSNH